MGSVIEEWRTIEGFGGLYEVSSMGRIKSLSRNVKCKGGSHRTLRERILRSSRNKYGYATVGLSRNGKQKMVAVHRLVGIAFVAGQHADRVLNHKNGDKMDAASGNLEWVTEAENREHALRTGLIRRGENHGRAKLNNCDVVKIRQLHKEGQGTNTAIARRFGVSSALIGLIVNRKHR